MVGVAGDVLVTCGMSLIYTGGDFCQGSGDFSDCDCRSWWVYSFLIGEIRREICNIWEVG